MIGLVLFSSCFGLSVVSCRRVARALIVRGRWQPTPPRPLLDISQRVIEARGWSLLVTPSALAGRLLVWGQVALASMVAWALSGSLLLATLSPLLTLVPLISMAVQVRQRRQAIAKELPLGTELLAITLGSGLNLTSALGHTAEHLKGPLGEELLLTAAHIEVGSGSQQALDGLVERTRSDRLQEITRLVHINASLGAPLSEALTRAALSMRRHHARELRAAGAKLEPKLTLVMTLMIVPGTILLVISTLVGAGVLAPVLEAFQP